MRAIMITACDRNPKNAYSGPCRATGPVDAGPGFRAMPATVPVHAGRG